MRGFNQRRLRRLRAITTITLGAGLLSIACHPSSSDTQPHVFPPVTGLVATLEDEVRELPSDRIAWSTYWKLCWDVSPQATAYELQTVTGEGSSPKLRRQSERCFRIQAAAGENEKSQGLVNRAMLLALQEGQLAYRVRAVFGNGQVSAWSLAMAVGEETRAQPQRPKASTP
jgi:hypothetical protein